ncbi:hypothetical protein MASR1M45_04630 [Candidatus Kapaibacterium sp.]
MENKLKAIAEKIKRHSLWILPAIVALIILSPAKAEIRTFLLVLSIECTAIFMSALSARVYTKMDFTKEAVSNLGYIFIGVHLCVGLSVLGVYIAQFTP